MSDDLDLVTLKDAWNKVIDEQNKRISELEKNIFPKDEVNYCLKSHEKWLEGHKNEITELQEKVKWLDKFQQDIIEAGSIQGKQLTELKDQETFQIGVNEGYGDAISNLEEVLWEFIIRMEGLGGYDFSYFKKKLSGVSSVRQTGYKYDKDNVHVPSYNQGYEDRKTEKKEVVSPIMRDVFPEFYNEDGTEKDKETENLPIYNKLNERGKKFLKGLRKADDKPSELKCDLHKLCINFSTLCFNCDDQNKFRPKKLGEDDLKKQKWELISEFENDLKNLDHWVSEGGDIVGCHLIGKIIKKWEGKKQ